MDVRSSLRQISVDELKKRVRLYANIRWLFLVILSIAGFLPLFFAKLAPSSVLFHALVAILIALASNAIFSVAAFLHHRSAAFHVALVAFFLMADIALISYAVYLSGPSLRGIILYAIPIIMAALLLGSIYSYITAALTSIAFILLILVEIQHGSLMLRDLAFYGIFDPASFFMLAFLIGILSNLASRGEVERAKTDLIALASHQLRTPSTAVKGYLSMVLQGMYGKLSPDMRKQLSEAYLENERQLNLITSLLNVSALDRGELSINMTDVDLAGLSGLIGDVVAEHLEMSRARKLKFKTSIPSESIKIHADRERIRLVFQNLVNNACKFAPEGSVVEIKVDEHGNDVLFSVTDHGKGMNEADQRKLFQRFSRVSAGKVSEEGSGLGLYVTKRVVELHNGTISVQSKPGKGTTFTVTLPKG